NLTGGGGIGAFAPLEALPPGNPGQSAEQQREEADRNQAREAETNDFRQSIFATGTLGAINYIVRGMQDLPGRKSIMLMSDGFKLFTKSEDGFMDSTRVLESLRRLVDQANRASVVIYTMDARGLQTLGLTAADDTGGRSADQIEQSLTSRKNDLFDTQDGLVYLARQTGGLAVINNNDLSGGIRKMLNDQSYYLIGYEPDKETFDPKTRRFNKLDIKIKRPGARVRYRSGFFGVSDEQFQKPTFNLTAGQQIMNALVSPFAVNNIALRLNALFGSSPANGAFIRSFLHIKAQDLKFTDEPDGAKKAVFEVLAIGFGDNGVPVDQISKTYTITVRKDKFDEILKSGFIYDFTFPIKKPGAYQLRVALLDKATEKVGSANQFVEVPNLKKERLTLSGIVVENMTLAQWRKIAEGKLAEGEIRSDPVSDTALRQFKRGTILNYGTEVFNAKFDAAKQPKLTYQMRMFRDGKLYFEGKTQPFAAANQTDYKKISVNGSLNLGNEMPPGDYVLQIVVTDNLAKEKRRIAAQFVQFEIIE
ncbi:MAG: VWA domain-containing protein, partial [Acidobacteriota bacterium]|nr:VWA domain-containing protein [Acidobacteriota bacterium]